MSILRLAQQFCSPGIKLRAASTHAPTVFDKMIQISVTDLMGGRHYIRGLEGDNLAVLLAHHGDELGGNEVIGLSPEGRGVPEAHVTIANEYLDIIPEPRGEDILNLNEIAPIHTKNSRLASKIFLTRDLNNLSVALGRLYPWQTI